MTCPKCGNGQARAVSEVNTYSDIKGYGCCKGGLGAIIFGPIGFLCGLIGMGKGRSATTTQTLWVCEHCGNKFK